MEPLRNIINLYAIFKKKFQMDQMKTTGTWKNQRDGFSRQQERDLWLVFVANILAYFNKDKEVIIRGSSNVLRWP